MINSSFKDCVSRIRNLRPSRQKRNGLSVELSTVISFQQLPVYQCIDTFGFKSPKDKLYFFINGNPIETIHKDNGFYSIIEKLPEKFILLIKSSVYYSYECTVNLKENFQNMPVLTERELGYRPGTYIDKLQVQMVDLERPKKYTVILRRFINSIRSAVSCYKIIKR